MSSSRALGVKGRPCLCTSRRYTWMSWLATILKCFYFEGTIDGIESSDDHVEGEALSKNS